MIKTISRVIENRMYNEFELDRQIFSEGLEEEEVMEMDEETEEETEDEDEDEEETEEEGL